jgi:pyruvate kinase
MVTMPSEAADGPLIRDLLESGMSVLRINCAHDDASVWERMIANLRKAERELGRTCRVLMDLGGPKLRTGPMAPGPAILKIKPRRDCYGRVSAPARIRLEGAEAVPSASDAALKFPSAWVQTLREGDRIEFEDARGAPRRLRVTGSEPGARWVELDRTAYVTPETRFGAWRGEGKDRAKLGEASAQGIPRPPLGIPLKEGDRLVLTASETPGRPAVPGADGRIEYPAQIACTLPESFAFARPGEAIWFDDGRIGGVIRGVSRGRLEVDITFTRPGGGILGADKGINLPDTALKLSAITAKDARDLEFVVRNADLVGLSFVHKAEDVQELQRRLRDLKAERLGIVLKIETRRAFDNLAALLFAGLEGELAGVMIARGDLAIETGFERLAEAQEEILWLCEAAHVPVIWATQVLERMAKEGRPSRAEVTDAAMAERAECVMLNKGPYIVDAVRSLTDILRRMQGHQDKKTALYRALGLAERFFRR